MDSLKSFWTNFALDGFKVTYLFYCKLHPVIVVEAKISWKKGAKVRISTKRNILLCDSCDWKRIVQHELLSHDNTLNFLLLTINQDDNIKRGLKLFSDGIMLKTQNTASTSTLKQRSIIFI